MTAYNHKVGDKVKLRDDLVEQGVQYSDDFSDDFLKAYQNVKGKIVTISKVCDNGYLIKECNEGYIFSDEMIERKATEFEVKYGTIGKLIVQIPKYVDLKDLEERVKNLEEITGCKNPTVKEESKKEHKLLVAPDFVKCIGNSIYILDDDCRQLMYGNRDANRWELGSSAEPQKTYLEPCGFKKTKWGKVPAGAIIVTPKYYDSYSNYNLKISNTQVYYYVKGSDEYGSLIVSSNKHEYWKVVHLSEADVYEDEVE